MQIEHSDAHTVEFPDEAGWFLHPERRLFPRVAFADLVEE